MQQQNPLLRIWGWGKDEHGGLIFAIVSALIGVALGILPYFAAAQIIIGMLSGETKLSVYFPWLGLAGYAARTFLYNMALSASHKATFSILKAIRKRILEKLPKLPLGTVMDMQSGKMKQIIVDQVDGMETTLAHLFPEMTANMAAPVLIIIYLFVLDWRMAFLSLVTIPVGMAFMMSVMGNYSKDYEGAVKTTQEMNSTIVEYINGIEVIKAFNQGKSSYAKFTDRVKANASYYYNWMKRSQFGTASGYAVVPATLITILPAGWIWYRNGSLQMETFITVIVLSLGIAGPLLAAMNFVDTLAIVGTTVASVDELLSAEEQQHGEKEVRINGTDNGTVSCFIRVSCGSEHPAGCESFHLCRESDGVGGAFRFRQIHHCKAACRIYLFLRIITCLIRAFGRISAWGSCLPQIKKWKRQQRPQAVMPLSERWKKGMKRMWEGEAHIFPVGNGRGLQLQEQC